MYVKQKGIATVAAVVAVVIVSACIGYVSQRYLNDDAWPEELAEEFTEDTIEEAFDLPQDSIDIDLTPSSKER